MSTTLVRQKITQFLKTSDPGVLCIRGNWGTGKTYTWDDELSTASSAAGGLALDKYAYASLFGLNSVEEVKRQIANQTIKRGRIGKEFDPSSLSSVYDDSLSIFKKGAGLFSGLLGENYYGAAMSVMTLLIRDRLICIDDLERKGEQLRSADILGLISQLKDERKCKIVLLLNDEQLEDRNEFESYLEKVVDTNLRFAPTPQESADIALKNIPGDAVLKDLVRVRTTALAIDNVRVIRKLFRFVEEIEPLLKGYKAGVLGSVVSTIVLLGWCHLQPELAPSMDFIVNKKGIVDYIENKQGEANPEAQKWIKVLSDYGYTHTDEFDVVLLGGIEDGYFTKEAIDQHAAALNERVEAGEAGNQLRSAWRALLDSFNGTLDEALGPLQTCISANAKFYGLNDVISIVNVFRDVGRKQQGDELLGVYIEARRDVEGAFNSDDLEMYGVPLADDLKQRLIEVSAQQSPKHATDELFLLLAANGYSADVTESLASIPAEEYFEVLKRFSGEDFLKIRRGLSQYNNLVNPTDAQQKIMQKAGEALKVIAAESPLNKFRAEGWGLIQRLNRRPAQQQLAPAAEDPPAPTPEPAQLPTAAKAKKTPRRARTAKPS
ncbi:MAG: hypothetical protein EOR84_25260 [Mesorhizobium sp.]|uniref:hypothetical protein n=1 Tax=Mesorhizobium sp. TaxID=1871066 RepID=UPI000FE86F51|nr:hypothetical protein [Mesorhizobium sp.]RWM89149.1 MAG: hypothetical protein EOR84_25260 [Mesorhizobium sp.]